MRENRNTRKNKQNKPDKFSIITGEALKKIHTAFSMGLSVREAAAFVGIGKTTLYEFLENNSQLKEELKTLKATPQMLAKITVFQAVQGGDLEASKWLLDRAAKKRTERERAALFRLQRQILEKTNSPETAPNAITNLENHWARVDAYFRGELVMNDKEGEAENDSNSLNS